MHDDIDFLWTLIAGVLMLLSAVGVVVMVEGLTRRRTVSSGSGSYIATVTGTVAGWLLAESLLWEVLARDTDRLALDGWSDLTVSILLATIILAGVAERATLVAHAVVGLLVGGVLVPGVSWAREPDGVLSSISIGEDSAFIDAASVTVFGAAGWISLVAIMIIGPRQGRFGADGRARAIPGKSMPAAVVGALTVFATIIGVVARPENMWDESIVDAAISFMISGAAGAAVAAAIARRFEGVVGTILVIQGLIAGVVAAAAAPAELSTIRAILVGAVGAVLALAVIRGLIGAKVDDPAGVVGMFGAAGVWGSLAISPTMAQLTAQIVAGLIVAAFAIVVAGVVFGLLRVSHLLRVAPEIEVVGLDR